MNQFLARTGRFTVWAFGLSLLFPLFVLTSGCTKPEEPKAQPGYYDGPMKAAGSGGSKKGGGKMGGGE